MSVSVEPSESARYVGRRVLITGGGSGIGQACVLRILAEGGTVVAADISPEGLSDTVTKAGDVGGRLSTIVMDIGSETSVQEGLAEALSILGGLDTLVNAAGILRSAHLAQTTLADFELVLRVNLVGTFLVTREAIGALSAGNGPAVVNFSSTSAHFAHPYMAAYAASKGGVLSMTHAWAMEFAKAAGCPPMRTSPCSQKWPRCCRWRMARSSPGPTRWQVSWRCWAAMTPTSSPAPRSGSMAVPTCDRATSPSDRAFREGDQP